MTAPVTTDDVVQGAVKWLLTFDDLTELVGVFSETGVPWLFQHSLWATIEGSQSTAVVVSRAGGWAGANPHNTMRFPRLSLDLYADPLRDDGNNITDPGEVHRRLEAVFDAYDRVLHRTDPDSVFWGTVRTIGCQRLGEPMFFPLPDGDHMSRCQVFYGVTVG